MSVPRLALPKRLQQPFVLGDIARSAEDAYHPHLRRIPDWDRLIEQPARLAAPCQEPELQGVRLAGRNPACVLDRRREVLRVHEGLPPALGPYLVKGVLEDPRERLGHPFAAQGFIGHDMEGVRVV